MCVLDQSRTQTPSVLNLSPKWPSATSKQWPNRKAPGRPPGLYRLEVLDSSVPGSPIHADQDSGRGRFGVEAAAEVTANKTVR